MIGDKTGDKTGDTHNKPANRPVTDSLHPAIYMALVGSAAWFALAIWGFASDGYTDWLLVVVSAYALIAVSIPLILSRVGRDREADRDHDDDPDHEADRVGRDHEADHEDVARFRDWAASDFASWTGRSKAGTAAVEALLPLGAIAVGMTAIAIVFLAEHV